MFILCYEWNDCDHQEFEVICCSQDQSKLEQEKERFGKVFAERNKMSIEARNETNENERKKLYLKIHEWNKENKWYGNWKDSLVIKEIREI